MKFITIKWRPAFLTFNFKVNYVRKGGNTNYTTGSKVTNKMIHKKNFNK